MKYWHYLFFVDLFCLSITSDLNNVIKYHVQTNERIRLECGLKSKSDTEDVNIPFFLLPKKNTKFHISNLYRQFGCVFVSHTIQIF